MMESPVFLFVPSLSESAVLIQFWGLCPVAQLTAVLIKGSRIPELCAGGSCRCQVGALNVRPGFAVLSLGFLPCDTFKLHSPFVAAIFFPF